MKKRSIAVACLVLPAITATHLASASAASAGSSAVSNITNVKVAWADAARSAVKITWTSPLADTVELISYYGTTLLGSTAAGAPDQLVVPLSNFHPTHDPARTGHITVTDSSGAKAESVEFDQYVPRAIPTGVSVAAGRLRGSANVETSADVTPGDPLDVSVPLRYTPHVLVNCLWRSYPTSSSPAFNVPAPSVPSKLWVYTSNEWPVPWPTEYPADFDLNWASVTITAPASTTYRRVFTLSGVVQKRQEFYTPEQSNCGVEHTAPGPRTVVIQARKDSKAPWAVVGSTKTVISPSLNGGPFSYRVTNPGTRQYRVVVPGWTTSNSLNFGTTSATRTVKATTQILSAKFLTPTVTYRKPAAAYLAVLPGRNQRALLQAKNTSGTWVGVTYKTLSAGRGAVAITWKRRGHTAFRWYTPATTTSSGLTVGAAFTRTFYLTVR